MLEIERVSWKNLLSYGNYITTLEIPKLGQCLITGEVMEDDDKEAYDGGAVAGLIKKSNGAGKTAVVSIIQWILFGRTSHSSAPGDEILNWFTGKDGWGQIVFKNGDNITRTRNTDGHNELLYFKDGNENKITLDTLGTAKLQQARLNKAFNLDWEIFCGSTFFSQYGLPWMEMADQTRKKALERLLHVDRFSYYAKVAKIKGEKLDEQVQKFADKKASLEREIERLTAETKRLADASANFIEHQKIKHQEMLTNAAVEEQTRDAIKLPDIEKLQARWDVVKKIQDKINTQQTEANNILTKSNELNNTIAEHSANADALDRKIKLWKDKDGKVCTACEQNISHEHVDNQIEPLVTKSEVERRKENNIRAAQTELKTKYRDLVAIIQKTKTLVTEKQPSMTVRDAQSIHNQWAQHDKEAKRLRKTALTILAESNPYVSTVAETRITECQKDIEKIDADATRFNYLNRHYNYVHKAYHDRTKVKSLVFKDHIPFINNRLKYYLDVFGLDIKIELTESLGITSNLWGYKYESGGERKRTDVAFMLATFDFHEHMFGRQCNILVLDEVDGRMDDDGIDSLINIIKNDLSGRAETILIISHRNQMRDTFERSINVRRKNRFSSLEVR